MSGLKLMSHLPRAAETRPLSLEEGRACLGRRQGAEPGGEGCDTEVF